MLAGKSEFRVTKRKFTKLAIVVVRIAYNTNMRIGQNRLQNFFALFENV